VLDVSFFFTSKSFKTKTAKQAEVGGGGGSKESSYVSSEIGFPAFFAAAFLLENHALIFNGSACLSSDHLRRELADGTRGSEDQRDKSSETTCGGIEGMDAVRVLVIEVESLDCEDMGFESEDYESTRKVFEVMAESHMPAAGKYIVRRRTPKYAASICLIGVHFSHMRRPSSLYGGRQGPPSDSVAIRSTCARRRYLCLMVKFSSPKLHSHPPISAA
jgi:hypothetical protein